MPSQNTALPYVIVLCNRDTQTNSSAGHVSFLCQSNQPEEWNCSRCVSLDQSGDGGQMTPSLCLYLLRFPPPLQASQDPYCDTVEFCKVDIYLVLICHDLKYPILVSTTRLSLCAVGIGSVSKKHY